MRITGSVSILFALYTVLGASTLFAQVPVPPAPPVPPPAGLLAIQYSGHVCDQYGNALTGRSVTCISNPYDPNAYTSPSMTVKTDALGNFFVASLGHPGFFRVMLQTVNPSTGRSENWIKEVGDVATSSNLTFNFVVQPITVQPLYP